MMQFGLTKSGILIGHIKRDSAGDAVTRKGEILTSKFTSQTRLNFNTSPPRPPRLCGEQTVVKKSANGD